MSFIKRIAFVACVFALTVNPAFSDSQAQSYFNQYGAMRILDLEYAITGMTLKISEREAFHQENEYKGTVTFEDALRSAMNSFLNDSEDDESPLTLTTDLVLDKLHEGNIPDSQNLGNYKPIARELLIGFLNNPSTVLELVRNSSQSRQPEDGESIESSWIFYLYIPSLSDHLHWAVVDRNGKQPAYNYGFN